MRRLAASIAVLAALLLVACGGDDSSSSDSESGSTDAAITGSEMTAGEFTQASLPDEIKEIRRIAAVSAACEGIDAGKENFVQGVAIDAAQASPDTQLSEIVVQNCQGS